jgi:hypothetical protein
VGWFKPEHFESFRKWFTVWLMAFPWRFTIIHGIVRSYRHHICFVVYFHPSYYYYLFITYFPLSCWVFMMNHSFG